MINQRKSVNEMNDLELKIRRDESKNEGNDDATVVVSFTERLSTFNLSYID